ncbi:MAG: hypothetical protein PVJ61_06690 [Dehalococcoidia bacterium]|jgi:hypothetical protein
MADFRIGGKVKVIENENTEYNGKTGIILSAQMPRPAIEGQILKWIVCKVKMDETGEIIDCLLSQLSKPK